MKKINVMNSMLNSIKNNKLIIFVGILLILTFGISANGDLYKVICQFIFASDTPVFSTTTERPFVTQIVQAVLAISGIFIIIKEYLMNEQKPVKELAKGSLLVAASLDATIIFLVKTVLTLANIKPTP